MKKALVVYDGFNPESILHTALRLSVKGCAHTLWDYTSKFHLPDLNGYNYILVYGVDLRPRDATAILKARVDRFGSHIYIYENQNRDSIFKDISDRRNSPWKSFEKHIEESDLDIVKLMRSFVCFGQLDLKELDQITPILNASRYIPQLAEALDTGVVDDRYGIRFNYTRMIVETTLHVKKINGVERHFISSGKPFYADAMRLMLSTFDSFVNQNLVNAGEVLTIVNGGYSGTGFDTRYTPRDIFDQITQALGKKSKGRVNFIWNSPFGANVLINHRNL